jgi:hypothetical protein
MTQSSRPRKTLRHFLRAALLLAAALAWGPTAALATTCALARSDLDSILPTDWSYFNR